MSPRRNDDDVQPEQVEWLWRERIAIGKLRLMFADPVRGAGGAGHLGGWRLAIVGRRR
jgi:hypothetical protein